MNNAAHLYKNRTSQSKMMV